MNPRVNYRFGNFVLRPASRELSRNGEAVALPSRVFDCLVYLIENRDRAVGRDELGAAVWGRADVSDAQLSQAMLRARRAIGDDGNDQAFIRTMPKFGYGWVAAVEMFADAPATPASAIELVPSEPARADVAAATPALGEAAPALQPLPVRKTGKRWFGVARVLGLGALIGVATFAAWQLRDRPKAPPPARGVLVLPIDVDAASSANWIHLGAIDTIADRMRAAGVPVPPSETTLALLAADNAGKASKSLSERANATWIVSSNAMRRARGWRVELSASNADNTRRYSSTVEDVDVIDAFHACTDRLLLQLGYSPPSEPLPAQAIEEPLQRVQAALLENDLDGARRIVEQSPALAADPAEMRLQLALIDYRQGRVDAVAAAVKGLLGEEGNQRPWLVARTEILAGSVGLMMDDGKAAEGAFDHALGLLEQPLHPLDYARALAGRGAARSTQGRYEEGLRDIAAARMQLQQSGDLLAQARIDMLSGSAELQRRRPLQARVLLESSLASLQRFGAWNERMHAYAELMQCDLMLLDYAAAEKASDSAFSLMPRVSNELQRAETLLYRIRLRLMQGRLSETADLFGKFDALALGHARFRGLRHVLGAQLAEARGDHAAVIHEADAAIELLPGNEGEVAADVVLMRTRAQILSGDVDAAARALGNLPPPLRQPQMPLAVAIASAEVAYRRKRPVEADYAAILAQAEAAAIPDEELLAAESRVNQLLQERRSSEVAPLLGRLAPLAGQDFRFALLELRLNREEGKTQAWKAALERATALAGERSIPGELQHMPL